MFPKAPLPDAALPMPQARIEAPLAIGQAAGEDRLDDSPAGREIVIARRQGPNAVEMIREHNPGVDRERSAPACQTNGLPQLTDVPC